MEKIQVRDFFKGRNVFITGGTGFMGKVMIEKLLYSIPNIGNIYILIRPKRGKSVQQRLVDITKLPVSIIKLSLDGCEYENIFEKKIVSTDAIQIILTVFSLLNCLLIWATYLF